MVTRPVVIVVICVGFFLILQALVPKAMALQKPSNVDEYLMDGHRTHKRKNYIIQRARGKEISGFDNGVAYDVEPFDPDRNPEELSAFIVDYANMMRNDVILLDKSVETRTRKRGNIKVKKFNNQIISDLPCTCNYTVSYIDLGKGSFPQSVETRNCSGTNSCRQPFACQEHYYNLTILRNKGFYGAEPRQNTDDIELHSNLKWNWYAVQLPISVGCSCIPEYIKEE